MHTWRTATIVVAGLLAGATLAASAAAGGVTPHRIADSFRGQTIDSNVWAWWGTNQPDQVAIDQSGGSLDVDIGAGAQPDFNASGETRCLAHGDFDTRVDFNLADWPARNGVWVSLMIGGTAFNAYRVSWQFDPSEAYGGYLPPAGTSLPASDRSGTLRLTRRGELITAYYLAGRDWIPIVSGTGPAEDVPFSLAVFNLSNVATFAAQPVTVSFDNFRVVADAVTCP